MAGRTIAIILLLFVAALLSLSRLAPPRAGQFADVAPRAGDADRGAALFRDHCSDCHGRGLRGSDRGPPLLHPHYRPEHHADLAIRLALRNGVVQHHWHFGNMPPVPAVADEAEHLVAFIRREQRGAGLIP